jgi:hypothetical protein
MQIISWLSVFYYCLFGVFVFYQQLHLRNFRGSSKGFEIVLSLSAFAGTITGLSYLVYYGWSVAWWAPIPILLVGLLFTGVGVLIERIFGVFMLSLAGFIGWPLCAYAMFKHIPQLT